MAGWGNGMRLRYALVDLAEHRIIVVGSRQFADRVAAGYPCPVTIEPLGAVWVPPPSTSGERATACVTAGRADSRPQPEPGGRMPAP
jgi:hypothetical protein